MCQGLSADNTESGVYVFLLPAASGLYMILYVSFFHSSDKVAAYSWLLSVFESTFN